MSNLIKINKIKIDKNQPRKLKSDEAVKRLALNIKCHGVINPIEIDSKGFIITGETRFRAVKSLGWKEIPATVIKRNKITLSRQLSENISRQDMNDLDKAVAFNEMMHKQKMSTSQIAKFVGVSESQIRSHLRILDAPEDEKKALAGGNLNMTYITALQGASPKLRKKLKKYIFNKKMSAAQVRIIKTYVMRTGDIDVIDVVGKKNFTADQTRDYLAEKSPTTSQIMRSTSKPGSRIISAASTLTANLAITDVDGLPAQMKKRIALSLSTVLSEIEKLNIKK